MTFDEFIVICTKRGYLPDPDDVFGLPRSEAEYATDDPYGWLDYLDRLCFEPPPTKPDRG
jgi:hypothetical protein